MLELDGVSCRFPLGRNRFVQAVDGVSFHVGQGEALGLVGDSGCGKSTLARLVNRLADLDAGSIRLHGVDIGAVPPRRFARHPSRSLLQMVFQDANDSLDPRLTAEAAIGAPLLSLSPLDHAGIAARVQEAATRSLVDAVPDPARRIPAEWDPSVVLPPSACRFVARCPLATERCRVERPQPRAHAGGRSVACHHVTSLAP